MAPRKVYCIDTGIINSIVVRSSQDVGRFMENMVAVELHRRRSYYGGDDVFYWKDHQHREVDFVLKGGKVSELIQMSYASSDEGIKDREFKGLLRASKDLNCGNMKVITWDYEGEVGGVKCVPLWKWLLADYQRVVG